MSGWNAQQYLKFKKERTQPAIDLAARIEYDAPAKALDVGCGPGNSTAVLKARFPKAQVIGADFSENMVETAKKDNPELVQEFRTAFRSAHNRIAKRTMAMPIEEQ